MKQLNAITHLTLCRKYTINAMIATLFILVYACKKTPVSPTPIPDPDYPLNVSFNIDETVYNFVNDPKDSFTTVKFTAQATNATSYKWSFGDDSPEETVSKNSIEHKYKKSGEYIVKLIAYKGSKSAPVVSKSTGAVNVFSGALELVYTNNIDGVEVPVFEDTTTATTPSSFKARLSIDYLPENKSVIAPQEENAASITQSTATPGTNKAIVIFYNTGTQPTIKLLPSQSFRFAIIKTVNGVPSIAIDYGNITSKVLWDEAINQTQKNSLLKGVIVSRIRIVNSVNQLNYDTKLFFNARLVKI